MIPDNYSPNLNNEIRLVGELLSPQFDKTLFNNEQLFLHYNPATLLSFLKQHRLYPAWNLLHIPDIEKGGEKWKLFQESITSLARTNNLQMLQKTAVLVKVIKEFEMHNIPVLAIKGPVQSKILFDDFAVKASIDLDIVIDKLQFREAVNMLQKAGFIQSYAKYELNRSQQKYLVDHFHHLRFFNHNEKILLELHWQLNTNKYLLNYTFEQLFNQAENLKVGEQNIRTLTGKNLMVQLTTHGAQHAWARLDWLYEFSVALNKYRGNWYEIEEEFSRHQLVLLFDFSKRLSNEIFKTVFPLTDKEKPKQISMLKYCVKAIENPEIPDYTRPLERIKNKLYQAKFKKAIRYKIQVWAATRTNIVDWANIRLPEKMFFLYYLIRPAMMIINVFRKRFKPS